MSAIQSTVEYRDVPGFPGYRVGDDGSVWSCRCLGPRGIGAGRGSKARLGEIWKRLTPSLVGGGKHGRYAQFVFTLDGKRVGRMIHRVVLEAFVGPCPQGMQGCHNDGNTTNNNLSNLRWDTPKENQADRIRHGTAVNGERQWKAKLTTADVLSIRSRYAAGTAGSAQLAREYGVWQETICAILSRKTWKHLPA